ncbi:hypothetical protein KVT40_008992 [Elsinoe batatas]|uniref:Uncharacterized protein n=1 Tax=Elsinoe batatas TaxID=2601811 RepID=A0A8K0PC09_9PEZI|nr:hypothetical protein KVT40_008992 [Elsinoe batatas]
MFSTYHPFHRLLSHALMPLLITLLATIMFYILLCVGHSIYQVTQALAQLNLAEVKDTRSPDWNWLRTLARIFNAISCVLMVFLDW